MATWKKFQLSNYSISERHGFKGLANCGIMKVGDFKSSFGENSFERMKELKMVETKNYVVNGKDIKVVRLSGTGKKFVKKSILGKLYKYNVRQLSHDLKLSDKYLSLSQPERNSWVHEGYMKEEYEKMGLSEERQEKENIETVDACYTNSEGNAVGVEIVTANYSSGKVQGKMNAMKHFSGGGIIDNVR